MESNLTFFSWFSEAFATGGVWMWAIAVVHIATIALIVDRVYALFLNRTPNQGRVIKGFEEDIKSGKLDKTFEKAMNLRRNQPVAAVVSAGVQAARDFGGRDEVQARMDELLTLENNRLEKRTGFLAMLANVATLLGLLGTIIGLIQAFAAVAGLEAAEKSIALTRGVALAMNTTAYGLIVAIPALVMHSILVNRTTNLQEDLNQSSFKVFNWLNYALEVGTGKSSKKSV